MSWARARYVRIQTTTDYIQRCSGVIYITARWKGKGKTLGVDVRVRPHGFINMGVSLIEAYEARRGTVVRV